MSQNQNLADLQVLFSLTEAQIRAKMSASTMSKADKYVRLGRVLNMVVEDTTLMADVQGGSEFLYEVEISVKKGKLIARCDCPYDAGNGFCKHVGAVLLQWVRNPTSFRGYVPPPTGQVDQVGEQTDEQADEQADEQVDEQADRQVSTRDLSSTIQDYRQMLDSLTLKELRELAAANQIEVTTSHKVELLDELSVRLGQRERILTQVMKLDAADLNLLLSFHLNTPMGYGTRIENLQVLQWTGNRLTMTSALPQQADKLFRLGLLLTMKSGGHLYHTLPQAVRICLPAQPKWFSPVSTAPTDKLRVYGQAMETLSQKMYVMWNYLSHHKIQLPEPRRRHSIEDQWEQLQGWDHMPSEISDLIDKKISIYSSNIPLTIPPRPHPLPESERQALCAQLRCTEEELAFCYAILSDLGAIASSKGRVIQTFPKPMHQYLGQDVVAQVAQVVNAWGQISTWHEMDALMRAYDDIRVRRNAGLVYPYQELLREWNIGRQGVYRFLTLLEENRWVLLSEFLHIIYQVCPYLIQIYSTSKMWWIESNKNKKQLGNNPDDWLLGPGRFVQTVLQGPLAWMGLVRLGYLRDSLYAIQLTPLGALVIGRRLTLPQSGRSAPAARPRFTDDLTVILPWDHSSELQAVVVAVCQFESIVSEQMVYRLSGDLVKQMFEKGETASSLIERLERVARVKLPRSWIDRLNQWQECYGKLHLYQDLTVIELADDYALQELMLNTSLRAHLVYQFSPRLVAVKPEAVDVLVQEMEKRGYTPRVE